MKFKVIFGSMALLIGLSVFSTPAGAINVFDGCSGGNGNTSVCGARSDDNVNSLVRTVINTLLFVAGILAVIMIIVGGIRYTTSDGNSSRIESAKNTVLYSIIGLVVALLAYAIVNFVIARF